MLCREEAAGLGTNSQASSWRAAGKISIGPRAGSSLQINLREEKQKLILAVGNSQLRGEGFRVAG